MKKSSTLCPRTDGAHELLHTCSYFCERPECIKSQRDFFRDLFLNKEATVPQKDNSLD